MASPETIDRFTDLQRLQAAAITAGVRATEDWLATPAESRVGIPDDNPDYLEARRIADEAFVQLNRVVFGID